MRPRIEHVARAAGLQVGAVIEINSIAILKSTLLADIGATILPVAPVLAEIERGTLEAHAIGEPAISRTVAVCASKTIPLTTAAAAVQALVLEVSAGLCASGYWLGARPLP